MAAIVCSSASTHACGTRWCSTASESLTHRARRQSHQVSTSSDTYARNGDSRKARTVSYTQVPRATLMTSLMMNRGSLGPVMCSNMAMTYFVGGHRMMGGMQVSFSGFEDCGIMANLETLGLRICSISGRKIDFSRFAKSFPVLTELAMGSGISFDFTGPKSETDVAKLMLSKLQKLYFHQATFDGLQPKLPLGALKNLTSLTIESAAKLTSQDLQEIATLPLLTSLGLTRLMILKLRRASSVDDDVLVAIAQHFTVLKSLDITECTRVTDTGVAAVVRNCLQLESLEAGENDQLRGTDWLDRLLQARPRFQHLAVPGTLCESAVPEDLKLKTNTLSRKENDLFL
ncbi:unnamed protein product [Notodromas monacha]|uniref:Uncharacterized protein n=1 Tax=Notodromas monacha TaxID=399045 RepID=A0A7R9BJW4_9CRUS|nr:unnamed protein product [Notodromas monacha]CAG0915471.1 unnamed protein product [Notodromas monacha]